MRNPIVFTFTILVIVSSILAYLTQSILVMSFGGVMLILDTVAWYEYFQKKHTLKRNFPIFGNLRWVFEAQRDKIRQYFNESDLDGTPFNKEQRSIVFQRSKLEQETVAFGTQTDVYKEKHEFVSHSMFPKKAIDTRVMVGGKDCMRKYDMSRINISAMSYGALNDRAIRALNLGAEKGKFAHNTGEGGISKYHLMGGDLIFQVGTGYFGAGYTDENSIRQFSDDKFTENATKEEVKMIELKLSQGAKPGHGGILPAIKNTKEIAEIRGVEPFKTVHSPSGHSAFSDNMGLSNFIHKLRKLSTHKPIGIKFCVTNEEEIDDMIKIFGETDRMPDFITIDGSEGGTGSAPLEYSNNVGYPLIEGLVIVKNSIDKFSKKYPELKNIKIITSGKAITSFDVVKLIALGSDAVNMSRAFMFSLGCIQARQCNKDTCPSGITTNNPNLKRGLVVEEKYIRVYNFHRETMKQVIDMIGSMGLNNLDELTPKKIMKRDINNVIKSY